ncbi:spermatogenesis-associated protein 31D1-like [Elephas maximus indicus]|uniref:spermatogenesis-associated protein 31D1-like n=1 Tax=Elephas maximus indicus TaxID=99487 RepID=UPI002115FDBB|nr:spermatogenesis-associated protein 31D1-like [Elephas maximus indicus]
MHVGGLRGLQLAPLLPDQQALLFLYWSWLQLCISYLCSPLGQHHDTIRLRQMLCPDPSCEVCNRTTAEVSQLLFGEPVEDAASCVSPVAPTVPVTESSFPLAPSAQPPEDPIPSSLPFSSLFSQDVKTPLVDSLSPSPPGDSLPPEPVSPLDSTFPVNHFPPQSHASSPFLLQHTPSVDHVPQPDSSLTLNTIFSLDLSLSQDMNPSPYLSHSANLTDSVTCHYTPPTLSASPLQDCTSTVTQSKLIPTSLKSVSESSSSESPGGLAPYSPTVTGTNRSEFSWPAHAKEQLPSTLTQCDVNKEAPALYPSEVSLRSLATNSEASNLSFLSPDVLALLERQVKRDFLKKEKIKNEAVPDHLRPDDQLKHNLAASVPFQGMEGNQESPYPKTFGDHAHPQHVQLFWGLPSLHSESLASMVVSTGYSSDFVYFNRLPLSLSLPEIQPQTLSQSLHLHHTWVQFQAHLQSQLQNLPPSPPNNEEQSLSQETVDCLEQHVLQKQLENVLGIPPVVQKSQEAFCPPAPNFPQHHQHYQAHAPITIIPGNFPLSSEVRKLLEHHLRKRLIQHRWGLPRRIRESLLLMRPPDEFPEISESKSTYGLTWIREFNSQTSMDLNGEGLSRRRSFYERSLEPIRLEKAMRRAYLEKKMRKGRRHSPENIPKGHLSKDPKSHRISLSGDNSRALKTHLSNKLGQIKEGRIPEVVDSSWHAVKKTSTLPEKSHTQIKSRNLAPFVGGDCYLNICQELPFIDSSTKQRLEDHIKNFHLRMIEGLPGKVLESLQIFQMRECPSFPFPYSNLPSSTTLLSETDSKMEVSEPLRESLETFWGDKMTEFVVDYPVPATSPVDKKGQGALRQSPPDIDCELHVSPELPTSQSGTGRTPRDDCTSSRETAGMASVSREIFKVEELRALQSQSVETKLMAESPLLPRISAVQDPDPSYLKRQLINELKFTLKARQFSQARGSSTNTSHASDSLSSTDSLWNGSPTHAQSISSGYMAAPQVLNVHMKDRGINMKQQQEPWVPEHVLGKCQDKNFPPKRVNPQRPKAEELGGGDAALGTSQTRRKSYPARDKKSEEAFGSRSSQSLSQKEEQSPPESNFMKKFLQWLHPRMGKASSTPASVQSSGPRRSQGQKPLMSGKFLEKEQGHRLRIDTACPRESLCTHMKFVQGPPFNSRAPSHKASTKACSQEALPAGQSCPVQGPPFNSRAPSRKASTKACSQAPLPAGQSCPVQGPPFNSKAPSHKACTKACSQAPLPAGHPQKMKGFQGQVPSQRQTPHAPQGLCISSRLHQHEFNLPGASGPLSKCSRHCVQHSVSSARKCLRGTCQEENFPYTKPFLVENTGPPQ